MTINFPICVSFFLQGAMRKRRSKENVATPKKKSNLTNQGLRPVKVTFPMPWLEATLKTLTSENVEFSSFTEPYWKNMRYLGLSAVGKWCGLSTRRRIRCFLCYRHYDIEKLGSRMGITVNSMSRLRVCLRLSMLKSRPIKRPLQYSARHMLW